MAAETKKEIELDIGHVLFIDIVGYSKLLINEQSAQIQKLKEIVRGLFHYHLLAILLAQTRAPFAWVED
jgi:hypothetical protein